MHLLKSKCRAEAVAGEIVLIVVARTDKKLTMCQHFFQPDAADSGATQAKWATGTKRAHMSVQTRKSTLEDPAMSYSFTMQAANYKPLPFGRGVAVTGAAGRIGQSFVAQAGERYKFRLLVHPDRDPSFDVEAQILEGDLADSSYVQEAFAGMDTVVHLAADPSPRAQWDSLLPNNIIATRNVFEAAWTAGVRRVIFASSIHAVSGYPAEHQVQPDDPVNPGDEYGISKCFGEAMARYASTQHGLSAICIRIGAFQPTENAKKSEAIKFMNSFVSHRDLNQLICRCIDDQQLKFAIFHGLSRNRFNRMDTETARELVGYSPQDDFTELNRELADLHLREQVKPHNEGSG